MSLNDRVHANVVRKREESPGMIMCYVKQIMTWGLRMEFSTDNLKSLAQQLAEIVSAELMNAEEDVTVA